MSKTWFDRRGKKRTAAIEAMDTPIDDTKQGTYDENGETPGEYELEFLDPFGAPKKNRPKTEITAGGNS